MAIQNDPTRDYLCQLAVRLEASGHGGKGALLDEATALYGWSRSKLYAELERQAGWTSGRKARVDKGSTRVPEETLEFLGAMERGSVRQNGKQTMFMPVAGSIAQANGHEIPVSTGQLNRLIKARRLGVKQHQAARAPITLRSLHPNHVHQVDPSLCLVYYLKGKQHIIRDDEFYKNKLDKLAKVQFKCWRYVLADHTSDLLIPWYVSAAGESPLNLFKFLMFAWSKQDGRRFHGVSKMLGWDKGSANTSSPIQNLLTALEVESYAHAAGNARAKGSVENGNNLVETQFECRLRYDPVDNVEDLNAAATAWAEAYNANLIPGQDTRLRRNGMEPVSRYDLWLRIREEELRICPPEEACQVFLEGRIESRKVSKTLKLSYRHPRAERTMEYDVAGLAGVCAGDSLDVSPLLFGECAISIRVPRFDGEAVKYRIEPKFDEYDGYGRPMSAPVYGESFASRPETDADRQAKKLDQLLYPNRDAQEIEKAKRTNLPLMDGKVDAIRHLADIEIPAALQRRGTEIVIQAQKFEEQPLTHAEAAKQLRLVGVQRDDLYAWLQRNYPNGLAPAEIETAAARAMALQESALKVVAA